MPPEKSIINLQPTGGTPTPLPYQSLINLSSSITSAILGTMLVHPIDRALFLAMKERRPFFMKANFTEPYHALNQALLQKAIFGSPAYFFLKDEVRKILEPYLREELHLDLLARKSMIGGITGALHGLLSSPALAIKAHTWSDSRRTLRSSLTEMYAVGGGSARTFFRGSIATTLRDGTTGFTYEMTRHTLKESGYAPFCYSFLCDSVAAMAATTASSLFNFVRINQMATPLQKPLPSFKNLTTGLWVEASQNHDTFFRRIYFMANQMQLGIAIVRFSLLMPIYQALYSKVQTLLTDTLSQDHTPEAAHSTRSYKP